jgi:hypothetical protein
MADAVETYKEEQAKLRSEHVGEEEDVSITMPVEPEVNLAIYKDVESLLFRGFITAYADVNGIPFVFKSLNHHEFDLLKFSGMFHGEITESGWGSFLAYCVFMVDGVNILPERERWLGKVREIFVSMPTDALARMIRYIGEVNRRASVAVYLTEAFSMETVSRYRWLQIKGLDLASVSVTGINGTQRLGLNTAQYVWRAINNIEDRNEAYERDWEHSKFVGSCFAGKGITKVYNQDARRRREEREERMARKDKILREWVLGEDMREAAVAGPGVAVAVPRTVEELTTQLEKDIRGEKDWHDRVVEEHEERVRAAYQERREQLERATRESLERFPERGVIGGGSMDRPYSPSEIEEQVRRRKQLLAQEVARMQVDSGPDEKTNRFVDRWWGNEVSSQVSTTDRDPAEAIAIPPQRQPTTPFRRK